MKTWCKLVWLLPLLGLLLFAAGCNRTPDYDPIFIPPPAEGLELVTPTPAPAVGQPVQPVSRGIDTTHAVRFFEGLNTVFDRDGGALWGVPLHFPLIVWDPDSGQAMANRKDPLGIFEPYGAIFRGYLPAVMVSNDWPRMVNFGDEQWMVQHYFNALQDAGNSNSVRRWMTREGFVWHQPAIMGAPGPPQQAPALDVSHLQQRDARVSVRLEIEALVYALRTSSPTARRRAVEDALSIREARRTQFYPHGIDENRAEIWRGMPLYTEELLNVPAGGVAAMAIPQGPINNMAGRVQVPHGQALRGNLESQAFMITGTLWGMLLDTLDFPWQRSVHSDIDLAFMAAANMNITTTRPLSEVDLTRFNYAQISMDEQNWANQVAAMTHDILTGLVNYPTVFFYPDDFVGGTFMAQAAPITLPDIGQVQSGPSRFFGSFGEVDLRSGARLLVAGTPTPIRLVSLGLVTIAGNTVTGSHWTLQLNEGYMIIPYYGNYRVVPRY